ncbi:MAG TPA: hypothetical protein PKD20_05350 [Candidatus Saccharibacteria bacterium]|jgi:guanylate kinase|nr:hypothetical protein [Candidatus Saccharibacteria bacterium]HMT56268.1 hypothetical protein [Candidatus Saccharibacteria bacterium]
MNKDEFIIWARKLRDVYTVSNAVQMRLANVDLLAVVGPTGVGKTTIINKLDVPAVLSDVTRDMRPDEENNQNYHFRDDYVQVLQEIKTGTFAQFVVSEAGDFYGTHMDAYPEEGWCSMAIFATAIPSFRELGFRRVLPIYIMPPGYVEWMRRIGAQRDSDISDRIAEAITSIKTALLDPEYHFVLNDNVDFAVRDIKRIMNGEAPDEHRARLARETADILLERLGDQDDSIYFSSEEK